MHSVTSGAVYSKVLHQAKLVAFLSKPWGTISQGLNQSINIFNLPYWTVIDDSIVRISSQNLLKTKKSGYFLLIGMFRLDDVGSQNFIHWGAGFTINGNWTENESTVWVYSKYRPSCLSACTMYIPQDLAIQCEIYLAETASFLNGASFSVYYIDG